MSFDYAASAATATRLLTKFGAACTLQRQTSSDYDADEGSVLVTESSLATIACVLDYAMRYVDGTLIRQGDKQAFLAPAVTPAAGDRFTFNGATYVVVAVKPLAPAGTVVLFECQVRGAGAATGDVEVIIDAGGD